MKIYTTNYQDTFIEVAEDCPAHTAEIPPSKKIKTAAEIQYEMIKNHPYQYTSDEVIFNTFAVKNNLGKSEITAERSRFFSKGQACMRSSPLAKRYGFGIHHNKDRKIALFAVESPEYKFFLNDETVKKVKAMRSKRA